MNCEELRSKVSQWFDQELECNSSGDTFSLVLPFLKPDGDAIEIGIEPVTSTRWKISDYGETHAHFYLADMHLHDASRVDEFRQILSDYELKDDEEELYVETNSDSLAETVFEFSHALQSILALQLTAKPRLVSRDFPTIVAKFLSEERASYEIPVGPIAGNTGKWKFNFILNSVKPATLVKAISARTTSSSMALAKQTTFEILDVQRGGGAVHNAIVIADDEGERAKGWTPRVLRVFEGYDIKTFRFHAGRQQLVELASEYRH